MANGNDNPSGASSGAADPYRAYNFRLEMGGNTCHFAECSGLRARVHSIAYREGGDAQMVRRLPGPVEYGDITLRYGLTHSTDLWSWFQTSVRGKVDRRLVQIVVLDADGTTPVVQWNLNNAWLSEWNGSMLNALSREVAIESMTLVFESLERD
jgi:phage tail-like protein